MPRADSVRTPKAGAPPDLTPDEAPPSPVSPPTVRGVHVSVSPSNEPLTIDQLLEGLSRAGVLVFRWDTASGLTFLSGSPADLLGYRPEELMGRPELANRVVHPDFRDRLAVFVTRLHEVGSRALAIEVPLLDSQGRTVLLEARVVPQIGGTGRIEGFIGVALDPRAFRSSGR